MLTFTRKFIQSILVLLVLMSKVLDGSLQNWSKRQRMCAYAKSRSYQKVEYQTVPIFLPLKIIKIFTLKVPEVERHIDTKFGPTSSQDSSFEGWHSNLIANL